MSQMVMLTWQMLGQRLVRGRVTQMRREVLGRAGLTSSSQRAGRRRAGAVLGAPLRTAAAAGTPPQLAARQGLLGVRLVLGAGTAARQQQLHSGSTDNRVRAVAAAAAAVPLLIRTSRWIRTAALAATRLPRSGGGRSPRRQCCRVAAATALWRSRQQLRLRQQQGDLGGLVTREGLPGSSSSRCGQQQLGAWGPLQQLSSRLVLCR